MFFFFVFGVPAGASFLGNHRLKLRFPDAVGGPKTSHGLRKTTTKFRKTPRQSPILDRFCCAEPDVLGSSATFPERSPKIGAKKCQNTEGIQLFRPIWCILPRCFFVSAHFFRGRSGETAEQSSDLDRFCAASLATRGPNQKAIQGDPLNKWERWQKHVDKFSDFGILDQFPEPKSIQEHQK